MLTVEDTLHVEDFSPISVASNRYKIKYKTPCNSAFLALENC